MFRAEVLATDTNGKPVSVVVATDNIAIVARFTNGDWRPSHGVRLNAGNDDQIAIPPRFIFNPRVIRLLDSLREPYDRKS